MFPGMLNAALLPWKLAELSIDRVIVWICWGHAVYVSPCAAHYYRERFFEGLSNAELAEQRRILQESLLAAEEQHEELVEAPGREAAKLRGDLEGETMELRAKLAAVEEMLGER